ncbi:hypothetical protein EXN66_Car017840 [Channa argus]|uniref:Uncharacterized protein n=1 Tax=Channa argus TaxID=215402 RepID=A0A6G1QHW9_CHAAH|nr:hypothetical protein EXN66_Car017840 [Channa argus]
MSDLLYFKPQVNSKPQLTSGSWTIVKLISPIKSSMLIKWVLGVISSDTGGEWVLIMKYYPAEGVQFTALCCRWTELQ